MKSRFHCQNLLVPLIACLLLEILPNAHAGDLLSFGVDATVGLDQSTRDFIASLPSEIRAQVMKLLTEALPLLDRSVDKYLDKVNEILNTQIDHLSCSIIGTGVTIGAELKEGITLGVATPKPFTQLESDWTNTRKGFGWRDRPHQYRAVYSDFLYREGVTYCQTSISPETARAVSDLQAMARPKWALWYRLEGSCPSADGCYDTIRSQTEEYLKVSDPRDTATANAQARIKLISRPNTSFSEKIPYMSFDPSAYESQLAAMFSIQDETRVAKTVRVATAAQLIDQAKRLMANIDDEVSKASAMLQPVHGPCVLILSPQQVGQARPHEDTASSNAADIAVALTKAVELDSIGEKKAADQLNEQLQPRLKSIADLRALSSYIHNVPDCKLFQKQSF